MLTAAFDPTHTIHPLRHRVLHCRQGQTVNAENTEGVGFPGLFEKIWSAAFHNNILEPNILKWSVSWFPTTLGQIEPIMSVSSFLLVSFGHLIS